MGFLHLGWESATFEDDGLAKSLADLSPQWAAVAEVRRAAVAAAGQAMCAAAAGHALRDPICFSHGAAMRG